MKYTDVITAGFSNVRHGKVRMVISSPLQQHLLTGLYVVVWYVSRGIGAKSAAHVSEHSSVDCSTTKPIYTSRWCGPLSKCVTFVMFGGLSQEWQKIIRWLPLFVTPLLQNFVKKSSQDFVKVDKAGWGLKTTKLNIQTWADNCYEKCQPYLLMSGPNYMQSTTGISVGYSW